MKEDDLYNRRRFFKKTLGMVVPMLSMITLGTPMAFADTITANNCNNSCAHSCSHACNKTCQTMCHRNGCTATCAASCFGKCEGSCIGSCYRGCKNSCDNGCDGKCKGGSRSEVPVSPDSIPCFPDTIKTIHKS